MTRKVLISQKISTHIFICFLTFHFPQISLLCRDTAGDHLLLGEDRLLQQVLGEEIGEKRQSVYWMSDYLEGVEPLC